MYFITICTHKHQPIFGKIVGAGLAPAQMVFISKLNGWGTARRAPADTMMDIQMTTPSPMRVLKKKKRMRNHLGWH